MPGGTFEGGHDLFIERYDLSSRAQRGDFFARLAKVDNSQPQDRLFFCPNTSNVLQQVGIATVVRHVNFSTYEPCGYAASTIHRKGDAPDRVCLNKLFVGDRFRGPRVGMVLLLAMMERVLGDGVVVDRLGILDALQADSQAAPLNVTTGAGSAAVRDLCCKNGDETLLPSVRSVRHEIFDADPGLFHNLRYAWPDPA
jgi:hypothetical protein